MDQVRFGMIGSGFMGLTYSEAITSQVSNASLSAVAGGRRASALANDYSVAVEDSVEALVARDDVDAVIVATPDQDRLSITRIAAAAGKHVLVEKPMAPTVAECDEMIAACDAAGVNLGVVKTERFRRLTRHAKQLIDNGDIGDVRMMRTLSAFPIDVTKQLFDERKWMYDPKGGGLFMGMASHNTDFLRWLSGRNAIRVFAQVNTFSDIEATAQSVMAQIVFEGGVMGQMWISSEFPTPSFPSSEVRFQVIGSKGMLDFDNFDFLDMGKGTEWERVFTPEKFDYLKEPKSPIRLEPHAGVVQGFVDSVIEQRPPSVGASEGRAAVEICEACLISARTGQAVELPL
jgi:UDP-N-acetyl-2-amino-2-deoxyglucuronate dehydrogenase